MDAEQNLQNALAELRARFRAQGLERRQALLAAHQAQDLDTICRIAHQLRGSAGMFGFSDVLAAAERLSTSCRSGNQDEIDAATKALSLGLERVAAEGE